jgi:hypothetical protein
MHTLPRAFLQVKIDGRKRFFEWAAAGRYTCQNERGTMALTARGPMRELYFGFDLRTLFVRVDFDTPARTALADFTALRLGFIEPAGWELRVEAPATPRQAAALLHEGAGVPAPEVAVGIDQIAELAVPFERLGLKPGQPGQFFVELLEGAQSRDRAPREGAVSLTVPAADFEHVMWDV